LPKEDERLQNIIQS